MNMLQTFCVRSNVAASTHLYYTYDKDTFDLFRLEKIGYIRRRPHRSQTECKYCNSTQEVIWMDYRGKNVAYCNCPDCGFYITEPETLLCWDIPTQPMIQRIATALGFSSVVDENSQRIWKLGTRGGKAFYLLMCIRETNYPMIIKEFSKRSDVVLFTITDQSRDTLAGILPDNIILSLSFMDFDADFNYTVDEPIWQKILDEYAPIPKKETGQQYAFSKTGEYWTIAFEGKAQTFRDTKGMQYIHYLLRYPGQSFAVNELKCLVDGENPEKMEKINGDGERVDDQTLQEIKDELAQIEADILEEECNNEPGSNLILTELREKKAKLEANLLEATGYRKNGGWQNSRLDKLRSAVSRRIDSVLKKINAVLPELGTHFEKSIETGMNLSYSPFQKVDWIL
jgi:hypothetical protein